jgi:hypothetical protein
MYKLRISNAGRSDSMGLLKIKVALITGIPTPKSMQRRQLLRLGISTGATVMTLNACGRKKPRVKPQKILFLGNSFTHYNAMPNLIQQLAAAAQQEVLAEAVAPGGWKLQQHASDATSLDALIRQKWNYVALQEQSTIPAIRGAREYMMFPAVRSLAQRSTAIGRQPLLFMTWGRERGMSEAGFADYASMQAAISAGYATIAAELDIAIAPVGEAWKTVVNQHPAIQLWDQDGSHPSLAGSFLTACVFYTVLYRRSPKGIAYTAGLDPQTAAILQEVAGNTVLNSWATWRLGKASPT